MQILLSAGEASGEMYGAQLIEALRRRDSALTFFGAGGERMRAAGCELVVDARDLAVVGIAEVISHLAKILRLYKKLIHAAVERRPDLAVVIDAPAFNWRVARQMRRRGIPVVYYVCPQFWAWRQGRAKLLRDYVNKALVIFPFEEKFYRDRGVDAMFVGHPLADLPMPAIAREAYAADNAVDPSKPWITLMPGSRRQEARMNLSPILEAAIRLGPDYEFLLPVARTLEPAFLQRLIVEDHADQLTVETPVGRTLANAGQNSVGGQKPTPARGLPRIHLVPDSLPALRHSRAGIVASGTATVEAALMETPFVMVYRLSPLTYAIGKPRVKVDHYAMVNLISGDEVVRELVQHDFTPASIVREIGRIIPDGADRETMIRKLKVVRQKLRGAHGTGASGGPASISPADRASEIILGMLS